MPSRCAKHRQPWHRSGRGHEALAAARDINVDQPGGAQHRADSLAVLRRHQLHRCRRHPGRLQAAPSGRRGRPVRMDRARCPCAAAPRFAPRMHNAADVGGDVGPAFVDDPDQPIGIRTRVSSSPRGGRCDRSPGRPVRAGRRPARPPLRAFEPAAIELQPASMPRRDRWLGPRHVPGVASRWRSPSRQTRPRPRAGQRPCRRRSSRASVRCAARPARARPSDDDFMVRLGTGGVDCVGLNTHLAAVSGSPAIRKRTERFGSRQNA